MTSLRIHGGRTLSGTVDVGGSKNASLPIMAASILASEPVRLERVPRLDDVDTLSAVLGELGLDVRRTPDGDLHLETIDPKPVCARFDLVRRMRASFCVLGPLLARRGRARVSLPGGCQLGPRPVDLHLHGLTALGAKLRIESGDVIAHAERLVGTAIHLAGPQGPTVTGTANVLSAAVLARGVTTISGAAVEPEIVDLGNFLKRLGARIEGLGTSTLRISGVQQLGGGRYRTIADRMEAATLLMAIAISRGSGTVEPVVPEHLSAVIGGLRAVGFQVESNEDRIWISGSQRPRALDITAQPYPGVPTDVQAQWTALLSVARGESTVSDRVFPGRFLHLAELNRLGARIDLCGSTAKISGVEHLSAARVTASDLRASAALILAGLHAVGTTIVDQIHHLDRGYERLEQKLNALGAQIERISDSTDSAPPDHFGIVVPSTGAVR